MLMQWQLKEPVHQQAWYWPNKPDCSVSSIRRVNFIMGSHAWKDGLCIETGLCLSFQVVYDYIWEQGMDDQMLVSLTKQKGDSPLHYAVAVGKIDLVLVSVDDNTCMALQWHHRSIKAFQTTSIMIPSPIIRSAKFSVIKKTIIAVRITVKPLI